LLQTVNRAGRVLDLFSYEQPEWGATAVAGELGVAKSQAHELLVSLTDIGLLQRVRPGRYRLGWRVVALNSLFLETSDLGTEAARVVRGLVGRCGETLQLVGWRPGTAVCIAVFEGHHSVAVSPWRVGASLPAECTGAGKVLLASRPWREVHDVLGRFTDRTMGTGDKLYDELARVRRCGFAYEDEGHLPDVRGVAAPILSAGGDVIAALSMSVRADRWRRGQHQYTRAVLEAASRVSNVVRNGNARDEERRCPSVVAQLASEPELHRRSQ
jgi:IclR family KDG regulon transcriptional repressor